MTSGHTSIPHSRSPLTRVPGLLTRFLLPRQCAPPKLAATAVFSLFAVFWPAVGMFSRLLAVVQPPVPSQHSLLLSVDSALLPISAIREAVFRVCTDFLATALSASLFGSFPPLVRTFLSSLLWGPVRNLCRFFRSCSAWNKDHRAQIRCWCRKRLDRLIERGVRWQKTISLFVWWTLARCVFNSQVNSCLLFRWGRFFSQFMLTNLIFKANSVTFKKFLNYPQVGLIFKSNSATFMQALGVKFVYDFGTAHRDCQLWSGRSSSIDRIAAPSSVVVVQVSGSGFRARTIFCVLFFIIFLWNFCAVCLRPPSRVIIVRSIIVARSLIGMRATQFVELSDFNLFTIHPNQAGRQRLGQCASGWLFKKGLFQLGSGNFWKRFSFGVQIICLKLELYTYSQCLIQLI
jgi:hypothetical protein